MGDAAIDLEQTDNQKRTPLAVAMSSLGINEWEIGKVLLNHGANLMAESAQRELTRLSKGVQAEISSYIAARRRSVVGALRMVLEMMTGHAVNGKIYEVVVNFVLSSDGGLTELM